MPVYDRHSIPDSVSRGTLDLELKKWLPTGQTLSADVSIAQGRRDHTVLGDGPWPEIGRSTRSCCLDPRLTGGAAPYADHAVLVTERRARLHPRGWFHLWNPR